LPADLAVPIGHPPIRHVLAMQPASGTPPTAPPAPATGARPTANAAPRVARLTSTVNAYGCFSPDGSTIVFQSNATGRWQLYTIRADGSGLHPLLTSASDDITPVYSPDGRRILFVSERDGNREVYHCNADGGGQKNLSNHGAMDLHPSWSADGSRILFSSNRGNADTDDYDLYEMSRDGSGVRRITSGPDIDTYASWSPDGSRIVTRRVLDHGRNSEVFVMNADGSNPLNLTSAPDHYYGWPVWSPDGSTICYAGGGPDQGNRYLFLVKPDGSGRRQISFPWLAGSEHCYDTQPSFSRDGRTIVFTRYRPAGNFESAELCILEPVGPTAG
jgi:Tol biopolymer transport system component